MTTPRSVLGALTASALLSSAACTTGPVTGHTHAGRTDGFRVSFSGLSDTPDAEVTALVLADPDASPRTGAYLTIGSGTASVRIPDLVPDAYYWKLLSTPLGTAQWPAGGLVRLKVRSAFANQPVGDMYSFDTAGIGPANSAASASGAWIDAGNTYRSPYLFDRIITMVSTGITPAALHGDRIDYLGRRGGVAARPPVAPRQGRTATENYYAMIQAPPTLAAFKARFGFASGEVRATYYNAGDLGIARDVHCRRTTASGALVIACFVSNFGRAAGFGAEPAGFGPDRLDPQVALAQALGAPSPTPVTGPFAPVATVAMTFDSAQPADRQVQFMVYDPFGNLTPYAALDNQGLVALAHDDVATHANINVPDNCLTCHGTSSSYTPTSLGFTTVRNGRFLPFDPDAFQYSDTDPAHGQAATLPALKQLNALVMDTAPAPATLELLRGMYPSTSGAGPKDRDAAFTSDFIPAGWRDTRAAQQVYTEVVKPYCRSCHVSHAPGLDFATFDDLTSRAVSVGMDVCNQNSTTPMPQAEQTQTRMWRSGARAHLVNALGIGGRCAP